MIRGSRTTCSHSGCRAATAGHACIAIFCLFNCDRALASRVDILSGRVNDTARSGLSSIHVFPGDVIECEAFIAGWVEDFPILNTYQLQIESTGMVSGDSGALRPANYRGQIPLFNSCTSNADCVGVAQCGQVLCLPPTCAQLGGCPEGQICSLSSWCFQPIDHPPEGSPDAGVFVSTQRPDFVFFGLSPLALVDITRAPGYRWGAISLAVQGILDQGLQKYAGAFVVRASTADSQDGVACGGFTLNLIQQENATFFCAPPVHPDIPCFQIVPDVFPLAVIVNCVGEPAQLDCNRDGVVTLAEHRHLAECFAGTALAGTCFCLDADGDGAVDLRDVAEFQNEFDTR